MGRVVVVAYQPKPGMEERLLSVVRRHVPVLRSENLVTDLVPTVMRASDGAILEVFEWESRAAIDRAHANPAVQAFWDEFREVCELKPLRQLPESRQTFAEFDRVHL